MRALAAAIVVAVAAAAPAGAIVNADGTGRVPWHAQVRAAFSAQAGGRCGGAVRDAQHVVTAAHCTYDVTARAVVPRALSPASLSVTVGAQRRRVVAISSDPALTWVGGSALFDDALLTLDRPLRLGAGVEALAPVAERARPRAGRFSGAGLAGRGRRGGGVLRFADLDVLRPSACARYGPRFVASVMLCAGRAGDDPAPPAGCHGDSGGPLAGAGGLEGIASFVGPGGCGGRAFPTVFVRVAAPSVHAFLAQADPVPRPVALARPSVVSRDARPVAGSAVRCRAGRWTGRPLLTYEFDRAPVIDGAAAGAGRVVVAPASSRAVYRLTGADFATAIFCVVRAVGAGGAVAQVSADALGAAGRVPVRDGAAPTARFVRAVCSPGRCVTRLLAEGRLAGARLVARAVRLGARRNLIRSLRAGPLRAGQYVLATPKLPPGRYTLTAALTDAAGNRQAVPAHLTVRVRGG